MRCRNSVLLIFLFFVCPFVVQAEAPAFYDDLFPMTSSDRLEASLFNPSLLGYSSGLRISLLSEYNTNSYASRNSLMVAYAGSSMRLDVSDISGKDFKRFTLAQGFAFSRIGISLGLSYSWYFSEDSLIDDIETLTFSFAHAFSSKFLFSFAIRDLVMSRQAGGYVRPEYAVGFGLRLFDDALSLHADISFSEKLDFSTGSKRLFLSCQPFAGVGFGAQYQYKKSEHYIGGFMRFGFGTIELSSFAMLSDRKFSKGYSSISYNSSRKESVFSSPTRFLLVDIAGSFPEQPVVAQQVLQRTRSRTFLELLLAIQKATYDKTVQAIYLRIYPHKLSYGRTEELIDALNLFRKSGKKIVAYLETGSTRAYTIASTAHFLYLQPSQNLNLSGVGSVITFVKGFLDKVGLKARLFYKGKYKSAAEILSIDKMSDAHREAESLLLNRFYEYMVGTVAKWRAKKGPQQVRSWFKRGVVLASEALNLGIVDGLKYENQVQGFFHRFGFEGVRAINYYRETTGRINWKKKPAIAVIHITGPIVNGKSGRINPLFGGRTTGADTILPYLYAAAADSRIKGVVVRVQSGGGGIIASDKLWQAVNLLRRRKPVIVSMGDVAASGGYYLACGDEKNRSIIHAPRTCVTGSIGVFTGKLIVSGLKKKLGLKTYLLKKGSHAFLYSSNKDLSQKEEQIIKKTLNSYYHDFVKKVAAGRGLNMRTAAKVAQGRVWSGADAKRLGLVDKNCSILVSLQDLARKVGLARGEYRVVQLPVIRKGIVQSFLNTGAWSFKQLNDLANLGSLLLTGRPLAIVPYHAVYW